MTVSKERAWETLQKLSFVRVSCTPEELKAAKMIQEECIKAGVEAQIEDFEIERPEVYKASLVMTKPFYKEYHVIGSGNSGVTPEEGLTGGFKYIENGEEANLVDVKGKVVLHQGFASQELFDTLSKNGAIGYINITGNLYDPDSIKSQLQPRDAWRDTHGIPGLIMNISEAEDLVLNHPEEVKFVLTGDFTKKGVSHNVVASIEGTDLKDEILVFSAHYDSVPYSPGAWDNMTGSITIMELMHYYKEHQPRRTVKFVWCGSEEVCLGGSKAFCKMHKDELDHIIYNINFDMTGNTMGYEHICVSCNEEVENGIKALAKSVGYPVTTKRYMYSSDSSIFAYAGVPSCTMTRMPARGGKTLHCNRDTMDHLDPDTFMLTLNFAVTYSSMIINAPINMIPRVFDDTVKESMKEQKKILGKLVELD